MTGLVRFYEKHENDIRNEETKTLVAGLVEKPALLDAILNFCLLQAHRCLRAGKPTVERLIARYTSQSRVSVAIPDGVTLHARPVALIAKVVSHHGTPVDMEIGATKVYAGSMLRVLMAVGANQSARTVVFVGDKAPVDDLVALFAARLGEDGAGSLPRSLAYLGV
jgi:phosphotransferase system HPr-like phosphotransfer protein